MGHTHDQIDDTRIEGTRIEGTRTAASPNGTGRGEDTVEVLLEQIGLRDRRLRELAAELEAKRQTAEILEARLNAATDAAGASSPATVEVALTSFQVFWAVGGGYHESYSVRRDVPMDGSEQDLFFVPPEGGGGTTRAIRIDPGDRTGYVEIVDVGVYATTGEASLAEPPLARACAENGFAGLTVVAGAARKGDDAGASGVASFGIMCWDHDPQLKLAMQVDAPVTAVVRVRVRVWEGEAGWRRVEANARGAVHLMTQFAEQLASLRAEQSAYAGEVARLAGVEAERDEARTDLLRADAELAEARGALKRTTDALKAATGEHAAALRSLEELTRQRAGDAERAARESDARVAEAVRASEARLREYEAGLRDGEATAERLRQRVSQLEEKLSDLIATARKKESIHQGKLSELSSYQLQRAILTGAIKRTTESRSWRLTKPIRRLSRLLKPVALTEGELVPCTPVKPGPNGGWECIGRIPEMILPCAPMEGWVRIELEMWTDQPTRAHLYYDTGGMFNEAEHLDLGAVAGDTTRVILYHLPRPVYCFRLDPMRVVGEYRIRKFRITPLSGAAVDLMSLTRRWAEFRKGRPIRSSLRNGMGMVLRGDVNAFRSKLRSALSTTTVNNAGDYDLWRQRRALTDDARRQLRERAAAMAEPPLISVLMPTYNTPEQWLRAAIDSVLRQTYPYWELIVVDDKSPDGNVRKVIQEYAGKDARVRFVPRETNGNISAATNTGIEAARGEFVALLDHDDEIAEHALSAVAEEILKDRSVDMIYSDEDKLTTTGKHLDPFFKPDFSPEYLQACMYTCHLGVYRTSLVREIGGFRSEYDFAQDYDMVLRLTARTDRVAHIPDVLYHWRIIPSSTASGAGAKPEASIKARKAVQHRIDISGFPGRAIDGPTEGFHRIRHDVVGNPLVSIVIPTASSRAKIKGEETYFVLKCVESIRKKSTYGNIEIVVSDNGDMPLELAEALKPYDVVRAPFLKKFNLAVKLNDGAVASRGQHVVLLNDDIEVISPDWIEEMLGFSQLPKVGVVGCKLLFPDDLIQHAGVTIQGGAPGHPYYRFPPDHPGYFYSTQVHRNYSAVTGACMMSSREAFFSVGGYSPEFPLNYNDVDYCLKLRDKGYRAVYTPYAELYHHESVSKEGTYNTELDKFKEVWGKRLPRDPMFNPNLSDAYCDFRIQP